MDDVTALGGLMVPAQEREEIPKRFETFTPLKAGYAGIWDGAGKWPGAEEVVHVLPEGGPADKQRKAIKAHYEKLKYALDNPGELIAPGQYFGGEEYADVRRDVAKNPNTPGGIDHHDL